MKHLSILVLTLLALAPLAHASPDSAAAVPNDWYELPETSSSPLQAGFGTADEKLDRMVDRIFSAQRDALSEVPHAEVAALPPTASRPKDWAPWRFVGFVSDLSISASGLLGVLTFKGTPSISVVWQKREKAQQSPIAETDEAPSSDPVFLIGENMTMAQAEGQVDAIYRTVVATGRVKNTKNLRPQLSKLVSNFREMTVAVNAAPSRQEWYPSRLRADIEVSASGTVSFGTFGGAVRVRLEWFRIEPMSGAIASRAIARTVPQKSLSDLIVAMSEDLSAVSGEASGPQFKATSFNVGLGVGVGGTIGLVKASANAMGYLYFSRTAKKALKASEPNDDRTSFYLIEENASEESLRFARENGIHTLMSPVAGGKVLYKVDRGQFRKGLTKAMRIGNYFSGRAHANRGNNWAISSIKPGFAMSLSGALGLATLTGQVSAQIEFQNQNF